MLMLDWLDVWMAVQIAVAAFTVSVLLTQGGMILHRYWLMLDRMKQAGWGWLAYPLGYCEKCLAGQMALWLGWWNMGWVLTLHEAIRLGFFISLCIFLTTCLSRIFR